MPSDRLNYVMPMGCFFLRSVGMGLTMTVVGHLPVVFRRLCASTLGGAVLLLPALVGRAAEPVAPSAPARFWEAQDGKLVHCQLCPRSCVIAPGARGVCQARINRDGKLVTLAYNNPVSMAMDPIEKKPFFNAWPGEKVFSLAVAGCNMRCLFCQNWQISQIQPDEAVTRGIAQIVTVEEVVKLAQAQNSRFIVYTYTEPTIFYEYMYDIAKLAKAKGLRNAMHSCGYITEKPLQELLPLMDCVNIDLKGFNPDFYRKMGFGADLQAVLATLKTIHDAGVWLEITNLVIPGANDKPEDIRAMCKWIVENLGPDVPLHFSRFHPAFRLRNLPPTPVATMETAAAIGRECGLRYVYIGNVPGAAEESTRCPNPKCGKVVLGRTGYKLTEQHVAKGTCAFCGTPIAGRWADVEGRPDNEGKSEIRTPKSETTKKSVTGTKSETRPKAETDPKTGAGQKSESEPIP